MMLLVSGRKHPRCLKATSFTSGAEETATSTGVPTPVETPETLAIHGTGPMRGKRLASSQSSIGKAKKLPRSKQETNTKPIRACVRTIWILRLVQMPAPMIR